MAMRFVDDANPPHMKESNLIRNFWNDMRGQVVKVGKSYTRLEVMNGTRTLNGISADSFARLFEDCDCEEFFQVISLPKKGLEFMAESGEKDDVVIVCQRLLVKGNAKKPDHKSILAGE